ncbi:hypothetical protein BDFG_03879 [Blastomyces dermatitidis ATCC 26199]|nr:hypothetical protein BDFG_03879 [Blastomyces dermatitidis ATCC 26199]
MIIYHSFRQLLLQTEDPCKLGWTNLYINLRSHRQRNRSPTEDWKHESMNLRLLNVSIHIRCPLGRRGGKKRKQEKTTSKAAHDILGLSRPCLPATKNQQFRPGPVQSSPVHPLPVSHSGVT